MPQIEHNSPKFKYRIYWKLDRPGERWKIEDIADWRLKELVIPNQPTYQVIYFSFKDRKFHNNNHFLAFSVTRSKW